MMCLEGYIKLLETESHGHESMDLDEFASLQLDKPLPDLRVRNAN